ncbi:unnamed protein product, partial [Nesidiocoris tenuis]
MKLHKRTCARVVDSRNRSAYGLLSRAGRLVRTSAMLVRAASNIVDRRARIARLGTARLRFRQRGASPWRESRFSTNAQTELCFPALSCLLRR